VTPTEDLVLELLIARTRLGHHIWTLSANSTVKKALSSLEVKGEVGWKHGIVERTYLAWLTDDAKIRHMSNDYVAPILGGQP